MGKSEGGYRLIIPMIPDFVFCGRKNFFRPQNVYVNNGSYEFCGSPCGDHCADR